MNDPVTIGEAVPCLNSGGSAQFAHIVDRQRVSIDYHSYALTGQPDDIVHGAWYVAPRIAEIEPQGASVTARCVRCNADVWVGEGERSLAESCAAIVCSACTRTVHGIVYIPPAVPV